MAAQPGMRIGDKERESVAAELREHYAHGRLSLEEFNQRLDQAFASKTQPELDRLTLDLPHVRSGGAPLPASRGNLGARRSTPGSSQSVFQAGRTAGATGRGPRPTDRAAERQVSGWTGGSGNSDWTYAGAYRRGRPRGALALLSNLIALAASLLIVLDVMAGLTLPFVGRAGILVALFGLIRGILRRVFGGRGVRRRRHF
jgi:hypothetical protein